MSKLAFGSIILLLVTFGGDKSSLGEQGAVPQGELRIVDNHPKNWAFLTLNIFEHLVEYDKEGTLVPRLATGWRWLNDRTLEMTLRQGVTFHNGEIFDAAIVKLNWEKQSQLLQQHAVGAHFNFHPGSRLEVIDAQTGRFIFPEPDGGALAKLSVTHMANRQFYEELGWGTEFW
jgi:ABC-type transport system substrate-binding protein